MATFTAMEASVYAVLRDTSKTFVLSAEVKEWLNEAYLDLVARTGILRKAATGDTDSDGVIDLPADFIRLESLQIYDSNAGRYLPPLWTPDSPFLWHRNNDSVPVETLYRIFSGSIETYPALADAAYSLEYVYKPTALSTGSDVPVIPEEMHVKIVNYARAHGKWKEGEESEGDRYWVLYNDGIPQASPNATERENPGPFDITPIPSYWDFT